MRRKAVKLAHAWPAQGLMRHALKAVVQRRAARQPESDSVPRLLPRGASRPAQRPHLVAARALARQLPPRPAQQQAPRQAPRHSPRQGPREAPHHVKGQQHRSLGMLALLLRPLAAALLGARISLASHHGGARDDNRGLALSKGQRARPRSAPISLSLGCSSAHTGGTPLQHKLPTGPCLRRKRRQRRPEGRSQSQRHHQCPSTSRRPAAGSLKLAYRWRQGQRPSAAIRLAAEWASGGDY